MSKGKIIVFIFAMFMFVGTLSINASAQVGGRIIVRSPVVGRHYVSPRPFWGYRRYWGYSGFYDPYWASPYQRYQEQKFYLRDNLRDNQNELQKHQQKYGADGVITDKERRELDDNVSDVQKARQKLRSFNREY